MRGGKQLYQPNLDKVKYVLVMLALPHRHLCERSSLVDLRLVQAVMQAMLPSFFPTCGADLHSSGPILITGEDRRYLDIQNCAAPYETRDVKDICESADALIFDFANVDGTSEHKPGDAISKLIFSRLVNAFHTFHEVEQRRFMRDSQLVTSLGSTQFTIGSRSYLVFVNYAQVLSAHGFATVSFFRPSTFPAFMSSLH